MPVDVGNEIDTGLIPVDHSPLVYGRSLTKLTVSGECGFKVIHSILFYIPGIPFAWNIFTYHESVEGIRYNLTAFVDQGFDPAVR